MLLTWDYLRIDIPFGQIEMNLPTDQLTEKSPVYQAGVTSHVYHLQQFGSGPSSLTQARNGLFAQIVIAQHRDH